jgi:hypothetical protein
MVLPFADGSSWRAHAQTVVAQNTAGAKKAPVKRAPGAKKAKDAAADGKSGRAPAEIDRQLDTAAKSLTSGDADGATKTLDSVLAGGGLGNKHVARALYLRGVAHRKKGRPAQALADLTSAIWLKDGLNEADRAAALKERSEVSGELGVAESGAPASVASSGPSPSAPPPATQQPSSQTSLLKPPSASSAAFSDTGFPSTASPPRRAPPPRDPAPSAAKAVAPATSSWQSETQAEQKPTPAAPAQTAAKNPPKVQPPGKAPSTAGEGLGEFLSGLFGGGSSKQPAQPQQRSAWVPSTTTTDAPAQTASVPADRGKRPAGSSSIATSAVSQTGAYRLQVATLRSRTEADAVAARLRKEHGPIIGAHKLDVDQTVYGNMGTFYRVRVGPFGSANEPKALCDQLRPKGYDCLVVTN